MEAGVSSVAVKRLACFGGIMLLWGGLIFAKLIDLEVIRHGEMARRARHQQEQQVIIPSRRGTIFDRTGEVLAESVWRDSVYINPLKVRDLQVAAGLLSGILQLDRGELYNRMQSSVARKKGYLLVAHRIDAAQAESLRSLHLEYIQFDQEGRRSYPDEAGAAHVVGSVRSTGKGEWGLEKSQDKELSGTPGKQRLLKDGLGRAIESEVEAPAQPGTSITISIDERIQFAAENALKEAVVDAHAETGSAVVMDPVHGDILAMASYPAIDPSNPPKPPRPGEISQAWSNHAASVPFEPGSVFKVITLSTALETTNLRPDSPINCGNGVLHIAGRTIHEAHGGYGTIPMAMVLAKSSNIGAIQIGLKVGEAHMYEYLQRFGIGARTGVGLPAESSGRLRKLARWNKLSTLASVSMGHEVGVTTLQLAQVCAAVANGGLLVKPRIILKKGDQPVALEAPHRILKPETAITMRQMMEGVVLFGTGKRAKLDGYSTGGKTGSAQIYDFKSKHYTHSYNASFMGFAPVTNPAIVVVVTVNGTHGTSGFGGAVAAPVFKKVAAEALRVLDVPRDLPDATPEEAPQTQVAELNDAAIPDLSSPEPAMQQAETEPGADIEPRSDTEPRASASGTAPKPDGPQVPNFGGLSKREVVQQAEAQGIQVDLVGNGQASRQAPPPGSPLHPGERILVEFDR